jgi:hypothetical protein
MYVHGLGKQNTIYVRSPLIKINGKGSSLSQLKDRHRQENLINKL